MSMLYLWNPATSGDGKSLEVIITRGDSDQVGGGSERFVGAILKTLGIVHLPGSWSITPYRCNFYSEYAQEGGWDFRWDFVWRLAARFSQPVAPKTFKRGYLGTNDIDDYSAQVGAYRCPPFNCLVVGAFATQQMAVTAAEKIVSDRELAAAGRALAAPEPSLDILRVAAGEFHLRTVVGTGDQAFFESNYPGSILTLLAANGGRIHAES